MASKKDPTPEIVVNAMIGFTKRELISKLYWDYVSEYDTGRRDMAEQFIKRYGKKENESW